MVKIKFCHMFAKDEDVDQSGNICSFSNTIVAGENYISSRPVTKFVALVLMAFERRFIKAMKHTCDGPTKVSNVLFHKKLKI